MAASRYKIESMPGQHYLSARVIQNLLLHAPIRFTSFISNWRLA